jgi:hypothetical protein
MSSNSDLSNINLIINDDINDINDDITNDINDNINNINDENDMKIKKEIKKYSIDDFYAVKNMIREDLGNITFFSLEIQDLLDQMFQSVPIISRKKKIIQDEEWRKKKPLNFNLKKENQDDNEKIYQELKGYLNRISVDNYLSILEEINKLLDIYQENKDQYITQLLNDIFKKARMEPTYCIYYVKIILGLTDKSNIQEFINQLKKTYKETIIQLKPIIIEKNSDDSDDSDTNSDEDNNSNSNSNNVEQNHKENYKENNVEQMESYDDFCKSKKNKNYQKGFSQFVGELFNANQLTIHEIIYFLNNMLENIVFIVKILKEQESILFDDVKKSYHKMIEENILYLAPLVEISIENIKNQSQNNSILNEKINNIFRIIEELGQNKIIINKNRFLLSDLFDIYQKQIVKPKKEFNKFRNNTPTHTSNSLSHSNTSSSNSTSSNHHHHKSFNNNNGNTTSYRKTSNYHNSHKKNN